MSESTGRDWRLLNFLKANEGSGKPAAELEQEFEVQDKARRDYLMKPYLSVLPTNIVFAARVNHDD